MSQFPTDNISASAKKKNPKNGEEYVNAVHIPRNFFLPHLPLYIKLGQEKWENYCVHTLQEILPSIKGCTFMQLKVSPFINKPFCTSLWTTISPSKTTLFTEFLILQKRQEEALAPHPAGKEVSSHGYKKASIKVKSLENKCI